jgi:hypothetical protein
VWRCSIKSENGAADSRDALSPDVACSVLRHWRNPESKGAIFAAFLYLVLFVGRSSAL